MSTSSCHQVASATRASSLMPFTVNAASQFAEAAADETAGMKTLVAGQVLVYNTTPARDGRLKAVNLRLL